MGVVGGLLLLFSCSPIHPTSCHPWTESLMTETFRLGPSCSTFCEDPSEKKSAVNPKSVHIVPSRVLKEAGTTVTSNFRTPENLQWPLAKHTEPGRSRYGVLKRSTDANAANNRPKHYGAVVGNNKCSCGNTDCHGNVLYGKPVTTVW